MQFDVSNDEYAEKLNRLIDFFTGLKEGQIPFQHAGKEGAKYYLNIVLFTIVLFIVISNGFIISGLEFKSIALILLFTTIFMMGYLMFTHLRNHNRRFKGIVEFNKYNAIINNIQYLKTLSYEVDLSKLAGQIDSYYHLDDNQFVDEKYVFETWYEGVLDCLSEINNEVFENGHIFKSAGVETV